MITGTPSPVDKSVDKLREQIDPNKLPRHIAFIMDGNGRWAKQRDLPRVEGHRVGIESVRDIVTASRDLGIGAVTLYAFSTENWKRSQDEIEALMQLLDSFLKLELPTMQENQIRFTTTGLIKELPDYVQKTIAESKEATKEFDGMVLNLALNYGGRREIVDAARKIARLAKSDEIDPKEIDEKIFSNFLYSPELPDPDLLIRTSGEMRISNFLLWEIAYAEIWITPILWPDFRREALFSAIIDFQKRERRFGSAR